MGYLRGRRSGARAGSTSVPGAALPQAHAAAEGILVVAAAHAVRQLLQALGVAAAEHDVVGFEGVAQALDHVEHRLAPLAVAAALTPALADVVLEGAPVLIGHMTDLGRFDHPVDDERRTQPGAEPEEQHAAAAVAADRLHGGVVDHLDRPAERAGEVEADPAPAEVEGLGGDLAARHQARIAHGHGVVAVGADERADLAHHGARRHVGSGFELADRSAGIDAQLDVRAADVQHQDAPRRAPAGASLCALHRQILPGLARFGHGRASGGAACKPLPVPAAVKLDRRRPTHERLKPCEPAM